MSRLVTGVSMGDASGAYGVDMRDEIITNATQFLAAIYRFRANHTEKIGWIHLSPTQEYCLKIDHQKTVYNDKEDRPFKVEEIGSLQQFAGYKVVVS